MDEHHVCVSIVALDADRIPAWKRLRAALWPHLTASDNDDDCADILRDERRWAVFIAQSSRGEAIGFIDASLRQYAEGCDSRPVGYVEGWFVDPQWRRRGVGAKLVAAAERWARSQGCTEMASDAEIENGTSHLAHAGLGYTEVERQVCFRKSLVEEGAAASAPKAGTPPARSPGGTTP